MGKIIDPRQQTEGEEEYGDGKELSKRPPWSLKDLPALKELHKETRQDAKLAARRTDLNESDRDSYIMLKKK